MRIEPVAGLRGELSMPGDKSISHRAAMIAAMADGSSTIKNFATSLDCSSTLNILRALGVPVSQDGTIVKIDGVGTHGFTAADEPLDCGNSGTTMRLMSGILAGQAFRSRLIGDGSLSSRPMRRIIEPLEKMGARIDALDGHAPLDICGSPGLVGIEYCPSAASAQLKSAILFAGLLARGRTQVVERTPTRDHTERMLQWFGVDIKTSTEPDAARIALDGGQRLSARDLDVPGDISSAAFFIVAAACLPASELTIRQVGLNPSRSGIIELLREMGVDIETANESSISNEPVGDLIVRGGGGQDGRINVVRGNIIPNIIDEIPVLAVLGSQMKGGLEIRDAGELRVKESDRISAVTTNLRLMGAMVQEFPDGIRVEHSALHGAKLDSFSDHRIAMAFTVAALCADGPSEIMGADCTNVSFPGFFDSVTSVVSS